MSKIERIRFSKYRIFLLVIAIAGGIAIIICLYIQILHRIPDTIYINTQTSEVIDYNAPVRGEIVKKNQDVETFTDSAYNSLSVDFKKNMVFYAPNEEEYKLHLKLFGILPYKDVKLHAVEEKKLIPQGTAIGIYVKMQGVLVIDVGQFINEYEVECAPAGGIIEKGDYITEIDQQPVNSKKDLVNAVASSGEEGMTITLIRKGVTMERNVYPRRDKSGDMKLGIWIRDSIQGIGTLTFTDSEGNYMALGHGINDGDTQQLVLLDYGNIYVTDIVAINKGENGKPGGLTGVIEYTKENIKGDIVANTVCGISGKLYAPISEEPMQSYPIGYRQDVTKGDAQIICSVSGKREVFDVKITEINNNNDNKKREIALYVTDPKLVTKTGGIVQGMSGSPIIQNGKLIGAVTHVTVRNPRYGYGIFVENMLFDAMRID